MEKLPIYTHFSRLLFILTQVMSIYTLCVQIKSFNKRLCIQKLGCNFSHTLASFRWYAIKRLAPKQNYLIQHSVE